MAQDYDYGQLIDDFELGVDVMPDETLTQYIERRRREFESKADGGSIGIEVFFGPKREDFSIGGRAKPTQTYDPRASAVDYATALEKVGGGTAAQKRQDLSNYLGNLIATQGQKAGTAAVIPLQAAKGVLGIQGTPITGSMQASLQNIIQKQIQDTGKLSGNINYSDYGVLTDRKGQEFLGFGDRSFTDPEAALATTLGKASYAVDPITGKVTFTGGTAYDFGDDQFGGLGKFISKGGVFSDKATQYNPDITLGSDFMKQTRKPLSDKEKFRLGLFAANQVDEKTGDRLYDVDRLYNEYQQSPGPGFFSLREMYDRFKQFYADGGRVGLFMGGDPLTGQALQIYNSMNAYGFSDQEIADALKARGLYDVAPAVETPVTNTATNIINQGGGDKDNTPPPKDPYAGLGYSSENFGLGKDLVNKDAVFDYEADAAKVGRTFKGQLNKIGLGIFSSLKNLPTPFNLVRKGIEFAKQKELEKKAREEAIARDAFREAMRQGPSFYDTLNEGRGASVSRSSREEAGSGFGDVSESGPFKDGGLATMFTRRR